MSAINPAHQPGGGENQKIYELLEKFLESDNPERLFRHPTGHPAKPTGFCWCDRSLKEKIKLLWRAFIMELVLRLPFNRPKLWVLRRFGAKVGRNVYISAGSWIDPLFPQLLTMEDEVFVGLGARIALHEFRADEFRAGRVILRRGCILGGFSLIGCGVEVGEGATVAGGAVVGRDVPPGATAVGNPARMVLDKKTRTEELLQ